MQNSFEVVDNFLNQQDFLKIKKLLLSDDFPWYFIPYVSHKDSNDGSYFAHKFFEGIAISNFISLLCPLIDKINPKALIRIKGNLYPGEKELKEHTPHADYDYLHKGLIFSINTCDGFTRLKCGTKIPSVENRALFFNASELHNSSTCTTSNARVNINFNYF